MASEAPANRKVVVFNACKREQLTVNSGYSQLHRRLRGTYQVKANKDDLGADRLGEANLMVFGCPREKFTEAEIDGLKGFVERGGSILFLAGEGGDAATGSNLNDVTSHFGMTVRNDSVVRTVYYKYLYPKEVFIANGVLQPSIAQSKNVTAMASKRSKPTPAMDKPVDTANNGGLNFVYPYGATLELQSPAMGVLSSGPISYPLNRPVAAAYESPTIARFSEEEAQEAGAPRRGRVVVVGSSKIFSDDWLDKEENAKLADVLICWLLHQKDVAIEARKEADINDYMHIPSTQALAERVRSCLQESEELPKDFQKLFNDTLFKFDTDLIPEAVALYDKLGVKHEPLSVIPPEFESPLPPLNPAVFPPSLRELPPPALDQFDLDEQFASPKQRLAQLTNKCHGPDDLDYFVRESGEIIGVTQQLEGQKTSKHILNFILQELVKFKSINQDGGGGAVGGGGFAPEDLMRQTGRLPETFVQEEALVTMHK
uniref:Intraflagellar transport protein 52 homolog n=1 Tax=Rhizochromulina marina TaxID=1034831 RepID=A0A7S2W697_9STRA|eukprot:CAMPEP_0118963102 /NCGR_PEP_ID=MMETSP1173-20130426/1160_1 /TAXON_ID=1034831 /ORGANISM="Rhizochromulina marina cf, Strain CCMP1243" /LENGTH=486 /DNA_ID=CAMNT_0006911417 /DNA_START=25 /DNA_END=1485 /DNA_ORIENTATION=+